MELKEHNISSRKGKKYIVIVVIAGFLLILGLFFYSAFGGNFSMTSMIVKEPVISGIPVSAELTIPELELKGEFEHVIILGSSDSFLHIGNQKFSLSNLSRNKIIFENYDGRIGFNGIFISKLSGKSNNVVLNGMMMSPSSGESTKIYIESDIDYSILEIFEGVLIKEISYNASGNVKLSDGKKSFYFDNEEVYLKNYFGSLKIKNNKLFLDGSVEKIEVSGEEKVIVE